VDPIEVQIPTPGTTIPNGRRADPDISAAISGMLPADELGHFDRLTPGGKEIRDENNVLFPKGRAALQRGEVEVLENLGAGVRWTRLCFAQPLSLRGGDETSTAEQITQPPHARLAACVYFTESGKFLARGYVRQLS